MYRSQQECQKRHGFAIYWILLVIAGLGPIDAHCEIIKAHEPKYSEAVLAYNSQNYKEAVRLLNELLVQAPGLIEFLELKALVLKSAKDDVESAKTYQQLIQSKQTAGAPTRDLAPYYFELGVIHFRQKDFDRAEPNLSFAAAQGFNAGAAHFFLGMITFQKSRYPEAETHFQGVLKSQIDDLKPVSLFYLGQVYMKNGYPSGATSSFSAAKAKAKEILDSKEAAQSSKEMAKEIYDACNKIIEPMDKSRWFASASLMLGYDSNVQALPNALAGTETLGKSSDKATFSGGLGYMTSPTKTYQFVPNYRINFNYNTNRLSREGEFLTQTLSTYVNRRPLETTNVGLKAELNHTFQNQFDTGSTTTSTFRPYSLSASVGPYIRTEVINRWSALFEITAGPSKDYTDDKALQADKRSGSVVNGRMTVNRQITTRFFNPSFSLGYSLNKTDGTEYDSSGYSASLNNGFNFGDRFRASLGISYSPTDYSKRSEGVRHDKNYNYTLNAQYTLSAKVTLLFDATITKNISNVADLYQYNRFNTNVGFSYSFF